MAEYWDLYDACGLPTGETAERAGELPKGRYHPVVHIWPVNKKGELLVQKRAERVEWEPGIWAATGGSALAGEDIFTACRREAKEELGIGIDRENTEFVMAIKRKNSLCHVYVCRIDVPAEALVLQKSEVAKVAWVPLEELERRMAEGTFYRYDYFEWLKAYLSLQEKQ